MHKYSFEPYSCLQYCLFSSHGNKTLWIERERWADVHVQKKRNDSRQKCCRMTFMNGEICEFAVCGGGMDRWMDGRVNEWFVRVIAACCYIWIQATPLSAANVMFHYHHWATRYHTHWAALQSYLCYDGMLLQAHGDPVSVVARISF